MRLLLRNEGTSAIRVMSTIADQIDLGTILDFFDPCIDPLKLRLRDFTFEDPFLIDVLTVGLNLFQAGQMLLPLELVADRRLAAADEVTLREVQRCRTFSTLLRPSVTHSVR